MLKSIGFTVKSTNDIPDIPKSAQKGNMDKSEGVSPVIGFWIFMFLMDLLIPATMIGFGWMFLHNPPKNINATFGYRTTMSMKNQDTWDFAHRYCGKLWYRMGLGLLPVTVLFSLLLFGREIAVVGVYGIVFAMLQCIPLAGVIIPTERALKRTFDQNGLRK